MKTSPVIWPLILKDLRLHRAQITISLVVGLVSLALFEVGTEVPVVIGACLFFISMIVLGCTLPMTNLINERKKHNLAFVMSLPVSTTQYTVAKLASTVGMFLLSWVILLAGALYAISAGRQFRTALSRCCSCSLDSSLSASVSLSPRRW